MKSNHNTIPNVIIELWRRRFAIYGKQRVSALLVPALGLGIMLFITPTAQYKIDILAKVFALSVLIFIAALVYLTRLNGALLFGKYTHQLFVLLVSFYFIASGLEISLWLLYGSQFLFMLSSIQISAILILGALIFSILLTVLAAAYLIRWHLQKNQERGVSISIVLALINIVPGLGILTSVISNISGKEDITRAVLGFFIIVLAIVLMSAMTYALCEFVFIAFRKWPEVVESGSDIVVE
jgi:hypothetical protein